MDTRPFIIHQSGKRIELAREEPAGPCNCPTGRHALFEGWERLAQSITKHGPHRDDKRERKETQVKSGVCRKDSPNSQKSTIANESFERTDGAAEGRGFGGRNYRHDGSGVFLLVNVNPCVCVLNGCPTLLHVLLLAQPLVTMLRTGSTGPYASIYPSRHRTEPEGKAAVAVRPCARLRGSLPAVSERRVVECSGC